MAKPAFPLPALPFICQSNIEQVTSLSLPQLSHLYNGKDQRTYFRYCCNNRISLYMQSSLKSAWQRVSSNYILANVSFHYYHCCLLSVSESAWCVSLQIHKISYCSRYSEMSLNGINYL